MHKNIAYVLGLIFILIILYCVFIREDFENFDVINTNISSLAASASNNRNPANVRVDTIRPVLAPKPAPKPTPIPLDPLAENNLKDLMIRELLKLDKNDLVKYSDSFLSILGASTDLFIDILKISVEGSTKFMQEYIIKLHEQSANNQRQMYEIMRSIPKTPRGIKIIISKLKNNIDIYEKTIKDIKDSVDNFKVDSEEPIKGLETVFAEQRQLLKNNFAENINTIDEEKRKYEENQITYNLGTQQTNVNQAAKLSSRNLNLGGNAIPPPSANQNVGRYQGAQGVDYRNLIPPQTRTNQYLGASMFF